MLGTFSMNISVIMNSKSGKRWNCYLNIRRLTEQTPHWLTSNIIKIKVISLFYHLSLLAMRCGWTSPKVQIWLWEQNVSFYCQGLENLILCNKIMCNWNSTALYCDQVKTVPYNISNQQHAAKFFLFILLSLHYMFQTTVSPIFRSTLTAYTAFWNNVPTLLSAADQGHRLDLICVTGWQQTAELEHCSKKLYKQSKCSWRWAKLSPETCRASLKESIKQILLHLVVCWYHCTSVARSH